jgi:transcriptional regulator with XRE-family HTH domain
MEQQSFGQFLAQVLREELRKRGMRPVHYAKQAGVSQSYISKLFSGDVANVGIDTLQKLGRPLNRTETEMFQLVAEKKTLCLVN